MTKMFKGNVSSDIVQTSGGNQCTYDIAKSFIIALHMVVKKLATTPSTKELG